MRSIIIGLSVIFFALSAFITHKAMNFQSYTTAYSYLNNPSDLTVIPAPPPMPAPPVAAPPPAAAETLIQPGGDSEADKAFATEMQEVITQLENKVATAEDKIAGIKTVNPDTQSRTVTVFGGKTFRSGQDVIQDVAYSAIENLVQEISAFPNSRILIEGHTDNIPTGKSGSDNMDLSLRRAKAIANILVLHGIPKDRISVTGHGDTHPITSNNTEEGRAKNRRVEVKLLPQEGAN